MFGDEEAGGVEIDVQQHTLDKQVAADRVRRQAAIPQGHDRGLVTRAIAPDIHLGIDHSLALPHPINTPRRAGAASPFCIGIALRRQGFGTVAGAAVPRQPDRISAVGAAVWYAEGGGRKESVAVWSPAGICR